MLYSQNHVPPNRAHGPLPDESAFVQAARESIPVARGRQTTATSRGRSTGRGRGRTNKPVQTTRVTSRKRQAQASTSDIQDGQEGRARNGNLQQQQQAPSGGAPP